jgi:dienelactone hydrolase
MSDLASFECVAVTIDGQTKNVFRKGTGPCVIVMSEIPGITPLVLSFADQVVNLGLSVALPQMFGTPGKAPSSSYVASSMTKACISSEFSILATGKASPITTWLRGLAALEHERCGGPGVGAIGMCLTGGFALAMMVDDVVVAPVLSQPSLPAAIGRRAKQRGADLGISASDRAAIVRRAEQGVCVLGLRFTEDRAVPAARFQALSDLLGDQFIGVELDSSLGNPFGHPKGAHSVLTEHLDDRPGTPTRRALDQVLEFFSERLLPA